ncbi:MAG: 4-alpha-glucanotransferase [Clostridiales bacterium]|nr:4-alpha-glucanotransferase [Clostridiales bacterium]
MKETGILMPVFSLPSKHGVGDLGAQAREWIGLLSKNGIKIWQILPLNPVGYGNSPYQPYSSMAGDELYISLEALFDQGLLRTEPKGFMERTERVVYDKVRAYKEPFLREAFASFSENEDYKAFISQPWVKNYGVFRAFKSANENRCWNEWPDEQKNWPKDPQSLPPQLEAQARYHMFLQYIFFTQWQAVKDYANAQGIKIMGDIPFYVGIDSVDVWASKENFLLDENGFPVFIAGVPPDYFSATGQRWGNPIYDWDYMKGHNYEFWIERIGYNKKLFDIIRIDHFRAFDTYWKIPAACPTAMEGEWIEAPGYEVLDTIFEKLPGVSLVAEDLGMLRPQVHTLKNHYHLKGMKIVVFSLDTSGKYAKDIEPEQENMIIYTGTHDNDTVMEWYHNLSAASQRKLRRYLKRQGIKQGSICRRLITYTLQSCPEIAIISMPDVLGLNAAGHINTPGTVGSPNWEWHMPDFDKARRQLSWLGRQLRH